jgi:hypothetical protein
MHGDTPAWQPVATGDALQPGDRLRTGRDGRAELHWQGATIRLYGDSMLHLPANGDRGKGVELEDGSGLFDVEKHEHDSFEVRTPDVVVSVKGTRFGVAQRGGPAEVFVYRGTVGVQSFLAKAREVMVREGFRAIGGADAPAEIFLLDHADPWSTWIAEPLPEIAKTAAPARLANDAGHEVVRRAAKGRALSLALKRNPKLADRLTQVRADLQAAVEAKGDADAGVEQVRTLAKLDPLLDSSSEEVERLLRSQFVEQVLNAPGNTVDVTLSKTGVIEIVDDAQGLAWQLDQNALVDILEGNSTLPAGLDAALGATLPTEQVEVATVLLGLLGH